MTLTDIESRVEKPKRKPIKGFDGIECACPSCRGRGGDKAGTNGSVRQGDDGWLHPHCHAGCSQADFMAALGLTDEDRRVEPLERASSGKPAKPPEKAYRYTLANGRLVFQKKRYYVWHEVKGWDKQFSQKTPPSSEHPQGQNIEVLGAKSQILYNLPGIKKAKENGLTVFINEGEKAADVFNERGLVGTCTNNGGSAGEPSGKWTPSHTKQLEGVKRVVIVADLDPDDARGRNVGREYAMFVAGQIWDIVPDVCVVTSATKGKKDDAYDHFAAGHDVAALVPRPEWHPEDDETYSHGDDFEEREAEWLIPDYLPKKKCILLDANGGVGKTSLCAYIAAKLSRGEHPFETESYKPVMLECGPVKTLYLHKGEDDDGEIETVYRANGGVPGMLVFMKDASTLVLDDAGFARIRRAIFKSSARFVVMDALFYFLEGLIKSTNDADQVIPILQRLNDLARDQDCTFFNCRHTKKLGGSAAAAKSDPAEAGMGTQMFRNKHRGQWVARKHPDKRHVVVVTSEKDSLLYLSFESFAYQRVGNEVSLRPNDAGAFSKSQSADALSERSKARDLVRTICLPGIPVLTSTLNHAAADAGISPRTIERARKDLGVKPYGKEKGMSDRPAGNLILLPASDRLDLDPYYET